MNVPRWVGEEYVNRQVARATAKRISEERGWTFCPANIRRYQVFRNESFDYQRYLIRNGLIRMRLK